MKVFLVRPNLNKEITTVRNFMFGEPLGIECVSTIFKEQGHEVVILDFMAESKRNFKKYIEKYDPDIIGFTSQCSDITNIKILAEEVKQINKKIVVLAGGVQAIITPEAYFDKNIDYVFKATTRENIKQLLNQIQNNTNEEIMGVFSRKLKYQSTISACSNEYVKADRESTDKYRNQYKYAGYQPVAIIQTSYGCRNYCSFCLRVRLEGSKVTELPIEDVVDEIESLNESNVMICDSDFLINEKRLIEFLDLLEKRNIKKTYICYGSVNSILEKEYLFDRLSNNGLKAVIVGMESFDEAQLKQWNKKATVGENHKAKQVLNNSKIACWGTFILHPDFSKKDFKQLRKSLKILKPEFISFTPLVPHPLTPLYEEYKDRLIYSKEDYEKWSFGDVVVYPSKMSLKRYYWEVLKLGVPANLNWHSIKYGLRTFPPKNNIRMVFGFNQILKAYIKNILFGVKNSTHK
ncbi:MAG: cobalamin-dependent protein [Defluviitaleaceae bacterium]|nr:cobalamin-dependent protein [Defluviitaleaceae bacterium]